MPYESLDEILRDRRLAFTTDDPSPEAVKRAIELRMADLQPTTLEETPEEYRLLSEARQFLDANPDPLHAGPSTAIVPMPAGTLEKLFEAVRGAGSAVAPVREAPELRMVDHHARAVTKASTEFRYARTLPLAGLCSLTAVILGTRESLGVESTQIENLVWFTGAAVVLYLATMAYLLSRRDQHRDEVVLRRLYDPDVQAEAVELGLDEAPSDDTGPFLTRSDFRLTLWHVANEGVTKVPRARRLSTVDLENAAIDSANLALERFVAMNTLRVGVVFARERFYPGV